VITSSLWRGKRYAVLGLARSGAATVRALLASGAEVVAWDENEGAREALTPLGYRRVALSPEGEGEAVPLPSPSGERVDSAAAERGEGLLSFTDPLTLDLTGFDAVVVSPGVPLNRHPIAAHAAKHGVPIIGDIELFAQARAELPPHKVVGITGTNGKSTTTALVHHILKNGGVPVTMGGNIGLPILGQEPLPAGGVYVLELSSYQIDLTFTLDCDVAVLLNITPDHLDRYESFEAYAAAKGRLFEMQSFRCDAVFGWDDIQARKLHDATIYQRQQGHVFGGSSRDIEDEESLWPISFEEGDIDLGTQKNWPALQGPHNAQNAAVALAVAGALHIDERDSALALRTFPGLPHRMERICEKDGVLWVNDSKATNPTSTAPALAVYPAIHWILGGQAKTDELDACAPYFSHVKAAYTIGRDGPMLAKLLRPHMIVSECTELREAVRRTSYAAKPGDTVLLSPACASFDQFANFEARGDAFRSLVEAL
jgi:UDP-N-acetylmuramoylalanine--D-glutamate ligase